ncbi:MAG: hypothetical protein JST93_31760 [Acidobacteria bacterium]|nr:hypothetical protein [Acidobacteriota bacterium]
MSGNKLFATAYNGDYLLIVDTRGMRFRTLKLPIRTNRCLKLAPGGRVLYIGSVADGFVRVDLRTESLLGAPISTGAEVHDLVATSDGAYIAMPNRGVFRWTELDGLKQLHSNKHSSFIASTPGQNLVVAYQNGGPTGRPGHDSIEIIDSSSGASMSFLPELPQVGGPISVSPDANWMVLDGSDACSTATYDGFGCPAKPSNIIHILHLPTIRAQRSQPLPLDAFGPPHFLPGSTTGVLVGSGIKNTLNRFGASVFDISQAQFLERFEWGAETAGIAVSAPSRKVFVSSTAGDIYVFRLEPDVCTVNPRGLTVQLTGDGTEHNRVGSGHLAFNRVPIFDAGRIGQSFRLTANTEAAFSKWQRNFGFIDSSLSAFIKLNGDKVIRELIRIPSHPSRPGEYWVLRRNKDGRLELELGTKEHSPVFLRSSSKLEDERWIHIALTRGDRGLSVYIDGRKESEIGAEKLGEFSSSTPFRVGSGGTFDGSLDELAIYSVALEPHEVREYVARYETGPCRPDSETNEPNSK